MTGHYARPPTFRLSIFAAAFCAGDFAEADRLFTQAQALAARAGDWAGEAFATGGLAMVLHHRNLGKLFVADPRPQEVMRQLGHSLALREKLGDPRRIPSALVALGEAELAAGHARRAAERLSRAVTLAREANLLPWRIRDAEQNLREAEAIARSTG